LARALDAPPLMVRGLTAGLLLLAIATPATVHGSGQYTILGAGSQPCGQWLRARSEATPEASVLQSWLLGYLTSVNANALSVTQDISAGTRVEALFSWVDTYCSDHPLDPAARAAAKLVETLRAKTKAR
jgi:hypothetical protein